MHFAQVQRLSEKDQTKAHDLYGADTQLQEVPGYPGLASSLTKQFIQSVAHQQPILPLPVLTPESTIPFLMALAKQLNISRIDKGQRDVCQKEFAVPCK